jgi:hypothetical protein
MSTPVAPLRPRPARSIQVTDHTQIVSFVLENRSVLRKAPLPNTVEAFLRGAAALPQAAALAAQLTLAADEVRDLHLVLVKLRPNDPTWVSSYPLVRKVVRHDGDVASLLTLLRNELSSATGHLQVGLQVSIDLLVDGQQTIYNPDNWVSAIMDPRQLAGELGNLRNLPGAILGGVKEVAKDDVVGAISGAAGAAAGGGNAGQVVKSAISGGVSSSVKSVLT